MEKKYSEAFSRLVEKFPEALGAPIFVLSNAAMLASGATFEKSADITDDLHIELSGGRVPVTDVVPKVMVLLVEPAPGKYGAGLLRATWNSRTLHVRLNMHTGAALESRAIDGFVVPILGDGTDGGPLALYLGVAAVYISGGELVEAKPTLSRAASAIKRKPVYKLSYTTVQLPGVKSERKAHQGGTHASPRQHERRGHWRTYRSGKRVWVKNCVVGDPSLGHVKHAYVVTQGAPHG